jgi:hypothetical protein
VNRFLFILSIVFILPLAVFTQALEEKNEVDSMKKIEQGFYVKGNVLGISENTVLNVRGDVLLNKATISGKGILKLSDTSSTKIIAFKSSIQNLEIDNAQTVSLIGELTITRSLTVKKGVFDLQQGQLITTDSTKIDVFGSGKIINDLMKIRGFDLPYSNANNQQRHLSGNSFFDIRNQIFEGFFLVKIGKNKTTENDTRNFNHQPKIDIPPEIKES